LPRPSVDFERLVRGSPRTSERQMTRSISPRKVGALLALGVLVAACVAPDALGLDVEPVEMTDAGQACVDFYRAARDSNLDEPIYIRSFADRIEELGLHDAAVVLSDLADQWEVGVWRGDEIEKEKAQWVQAGALLAADGAIHCADLAEWKGDDGYAGEPDPYEMLERQAGIWVGSGLTDYYLLVAGGSLPTENLTQIQVLVEEGRPEDISEVVVGNADVADLPKTVEEIYRVLLDQRPDVTSYDLVLGVPRVVVFPDETTLYVEVDPNQHPAPLTGTTATGGAAQTTLGGG